MEQGICDLCGSKTVHILFMKDGFSIVQCRDCKLVFTHPQDSEENFRQRYGSEDYFKTRYVEKFGYGNYEGVRHLLDNWFQSRLDVVNNLYPQKGKLLDVGCALGFFLKKARDGGWDTYGVDYSEYATQYAKEKYQLNVQQGRIEDLNFPENHFQVVTLFDVIEHVREPNSVFSQIHKLLAPGGYLVMTTPNYGGLLRKVMRRYWFHFKPLEHTYFFSPATMTTYLEKSGYDDIRIENCMKIVDIDFLINRAFHYNPHLPRMAQFLLREGKWKHWSFPFPTGEMNIYARKKTNP